MSTGERQGYATELAGLWNGLELTLRRLDRLAADPLAAIAADGGRELVRLQYALHVAGERVWGLEPPPRSEALHEELAAALAAARDSTATIVEAAETEGADEALLYVHEWRGALFRVRLARLRLGAPSRPPVAVEAAQPDAGAAFTAFSLTIVGAAAFVLGATTASAPIWVAGLVAVVAGLLVYRP